ncbi:MAG: DUF447 family protein [Sulfolobales archaeon]
MGNLCRSLERYLRYGHHESIATTVDSSGRPNSAPMGIELIGDKVLMKPYLNTRTYANILSLREVMLNITTDAFLFYQTLFNSEEVRYGSPKIIKPPRILGSVDLYVECVVDTITHYEDFALISLRPICCYRGRGSRLAYSRANSAVIEALIHYTKLPHLISKGDLEGIRRRYAVLEASRNMVLKVGSDTLKKVVEDVWDRSLRLIREAGITF